MEDNQKIKKHAEKELEIFEYANKLSALKLQHNIFWFIKPSKIIGKISFNIGYQYEFYLFKHERKKDIINYFQFDF